MKVNDKQIAAILVAIPDIRVNFYGMDSVMENLDIDSDEFALTGYVIVNALLTKDGAINSVTCDYELDIALFNEEPVNLEFSDEQMNLMNKMLAKSIIIRP